MRRPPHLQISESARGRNHARVQRVNKLLTRETRAAGLRTRSDPGSGAPFMSNVNITHVQSLYAAFGRGDIAALLAGCAADIDWETVGRPDDFPTLGPRKGLKAVEEFFRLVDENEEF